MQGTFLGRTDAEKLISDSGSLYTPQWYIDALGPIDLDPSACFGRQHATVNYTIDDDGLAHDWFARVVHLNPDYRNPTQERFVRHACDQHQRCHTGVIVMLIQAGVSSSYWHECIWPHAKWVGFPEGLIAFCGANGVPTKGGGSFSSAVVFLVAPGHEAEAQWIKDNLTAAAADNGHPIAWVSEVSR